MLPIASFQRFLREIEPSATTKRDCAAAYTGVNNFLIGHEYYGKRVSRIFLAGSYARHTAIRPRTVNGKKDIPDIDIIVVTDHARANHPDNVLAELADTLKEHPHFTYGRTNRRSVRLESAKCQIDVVPVVDYRTKFRLPDRDSEGWIYTNPPFHAGWSTYQNEQFGGNFKRLVKLLKWWKATNISARRPKGFLLEILVSLHAPVEPHFGEAFTQLLENIYAAYHRQVACGRKPVIPDPAIGDNDMLANVSLPQWRNFVEKVGRHSRLARAAQNSESYEDALNLWRSVFGRWFKG